MILDWTVVRSVITFPSLSKNKFLSIFESIGLVVVVSVDLDKLFTNKSYYSGLDCNEKKEYIVEDTKGFRTDVYKIKKKMFEYKYPNLTIKEI